LFCRIENTARRWAMPAKDLNRTNLSSVIIIGDKRIDFQPVRRPM